LVGLRHGVRGTRWSLAATTANIVFFPQSASAVSTTTAQLYSTDPLFITGDVPAAYYDFPDLSTRYITTATGGQVTTTGSDGNVQYRNALSAQIARLSVANEFVTDPGIAALTDLVFSQPTRRYYAAVDYNLSGSSASAVYSTSKGVYTDNNTDLYDRVLCVRRPTGSDLLKIEAYNREEKGLTPTGAVISPGTPTEFKICGEVAVTSINAGNESNPSALSATLARNNIELDSLVDGWIRFNTTLDTADIASTGVSGLPIIGNAHLRAANGAVNYGFTWPHKTTN